MAIVKMALVDLPLFLVGLGLKGASRFIVAEEAQSDFAYFKQTELGRFISKWVFANPEDEPLQIEVQLDGGAVLTIRLDLKEDKEEVFTAIMIAGLAVGLYLGGQAAKGLEEFMQLYRAGKLTPRKLKESRFMWGSLFEGVEKAAKQGGFEMAPVALYKSTPRVVTNADRINIATTTLDGTQLEITSELIENAELDYALGKRWAFLKSVLKWVGNADLVFFFATWMIDIVFLSDEGEENVLKAIDDFAYSVGWDEAKGSLTEYYGISLPTSPSDILISFLFRELIDAVAGESLPDQLPLEVFLLTLLGAFTDFWEVTISVVVPPTVVLDEPINFSGFPTFTRWVEGNLYELFEFFLIAWIPWCLYRGAVVRS